MLLCETICYIFLASDIAHGLTCMIAFLTLNHAGLVFLQRMPFGTFAVFNTLWCFAVVLERDTAWSGLVVLIDLAGPIG